MKIVTLVARILLGLLFVVFGLNGFLHFIPQPPLPPGPAATFLEVLVTTHYTAVIFAVQLLGGVLLLANQFVPLAIALLGPVLVNILAFHALMQPAGIPPALITTLLWFVVAYSVRANLMPLLEQKARPVV